jgi:hypothetical protein
MSAIEKYKRLRQAAESVLQNACDAEATGPEPQDVVDSDDFPRDEDGEPWFDDFWELMMALREIDAEYYNSRRNTEEKKTISPGEFELNGRTIAKMFTEWALAEGGTGGFLAWAAWISGVAPPEVQVWIDYKMPVGGNSEFYQRFLG